ncbi:MAG: hypothetical protein V1725_05545, partial [archaeon]
QYVSVERTFPVVMEGVAGGALFGLETIRAELVHPDVSVIGIMNKAAGLPVHDRISTAQNTNLELYKTLQHGGNVIEGYGLSFCAYYAMHWLFPRSSEKLKCWTSFLFSSAFIASYESGLLTGKTPDYWDIPAGVVGSLLYLGVHSFFRKKQKL